MPGSNNAHDDHIPHSLHTAHVRNVKLKTTMNLQLTTYLLLVLSILSCVSENKKAQLYDYDIESRLDSLNITLQAPAAPVANYVHVVETGNLLFLAGKGPKDDQGHNITGVLGEDITVEEGYDAARRIGIRQLGVLKEHLGDLNRVQRVVKVLGMVQSADSFTDQPKVVNGFSDLMVEVFGERGKHARAAVGMNALPGNICAEIEMIVEFE